METKKSMEFKIGDKVIMHTCYESTLSEYKDRVWTCRSDSYTDKAGDSVVFLEGFSGCFMASYLKPISE